MMQKIRAWDKVGNEMINYIISINFVFGYITFDTENVINKKRYFDDITIMQSTGLHDNNGVEIFEGDIVEHLDFNSNEISKSEVRILKGCFYLVISVDGFKYDVPMMDLKDDECILEIKGNVHENHELLEDV